MERYAWKATVLPGKLDEYGIANLKDIIGRSLTL